MIMCCWNTWSIANERKTKKKRLRSHHIENSMKSKATFENFTSNRWILRWECVRYLDLNSSRLHTYMHVCVCVRSWMQFYAIENSIQCDWNEHMHSIIYTHLKIDWCAKSRIQSSRLASTRIHARGECSENGWNTHKTTTHRERERKERRTQTLLQHTAFSRKNRKKTKHHRAEHITSQHSRAFDCSVCLHLAHGVYAVTSNSRAAVQSTKRKRVYWHFSLCVLCCVVCCFRFWLVGAFFFVMRH